MQFSDLSASLELSRVLEEARDIAASNDQKLASGHLLLALYTVENKAKTILEDAHVELEPLIGAVKSTQRDDPEPLATVSAVHQYTAKVAESTMVGTLHLLSAICRVQRSDAYRALRALEVDPAALRLKVISHFRGHFRRSSPSLDPLPPAGRFEERHRVEPQPRPRGKLEVLEVIEPEPLPEPLSAPDWEPLVLEEDRDQAFEEAPKSGRWSVDPEAFPVLALGRNVTELAEAGRLDPLIGRTREVEQLIDILNKRRANNPCLVGDPGVGKTAVVEGLAQMIVDRDTRVGALGERILIELDMGRLVANTELRGAFSERMGALREEVARLEGRIVLFIDEIHTLVGAGSGDGALDAANELKKALAAGEFPCIGATTEREYRRYIEGDPALQRRFGVVLVGEPSPDEALSVLKGLESRYSQHHGVSYTPDALEACVRLSDRWIAERFLPSKAIDVLDRAGAWTSRKETREVTPRAVARVIAQKVGMPEERLLVDDAERLLRMEDHLRERIIAHDDATSRIARVVRRNFAGFTSTRPMGSFLLLGPTGVGKTECARVLAEFLFGSRDAMTRIDMSEYMDSHSTSRLIGAPPGFVGHEEGGQLTESARRRPYQLILFDEVEKAHRDVLNLLLQLLDDGQLTDGRGRRVRFQHTVILMTSNLGHEHFDPTVGRPVGFTAESRPDDRAEAALESARKAFTPELWNRIEEKLVFRPLRVEDVECIAALLLRDSSGRLRAERKIGYEVTPEVVPLLIERGGWDERHGARPMRRTIQDLVEGVVADAILEGRVEPDTTLLLGVRDQAIVVLD